MIHHGLKTIFVHMPRCAGTAIRKRLKEEPGRINEKYYSHINIYDYEYMMRQNTFQEYFKFSVIRNPFDRVYSSYKRKYSIDDVEYESFEEWLIKLTKMNYIKKGVRGVLGSHFYWLGDPVKVDYIIRYENFERDWKIVCRVLDIDNHIDIVNKGEYNQGGYKKYHTKRTIEIVEKYFEKDLRRFNYAY